MVGTSVYGLVETTAVMWAEMRVVEWADWKADLMADYLAVQLGR